MRIVFLDNRKDVSAAATSITPSGDIKFIALTAEALQYLEELRIPCESVSAYADTSAMDQNVYDKFNVQSYDLARDIESYIAQYYRWEQFENQFFLSGLSYYLQYSVNIILVQSFLMREVIDKCSPEMVTVFDSGMDPWFADNGYEHVPWLDVVEQLSHQYRFRLEILPIRESNPKCNEGMKNQWQTKDNLAAKVKSCLLNNPLIRYLLIRRELNQFPRPKIQDSLKGLQGMRILMVQSYGYDWMPFLADSLFLKHNECYFIEGARIEKQYPWAYYYESYVHQLRHLRGHQIGLDPPFVEEKEKFLLNELFERWLQMISAPPELNVMGMNLFPALTNHLRTMLSFGPALARHADDFSNRVLDKIKPHVVCFMGMINLADKCLAFHARKRNIPVVCYQHGGGFGVINCAKDEQTEVAHADYFLTHGELVVPRKNPAFPVRANYVPIGSARIESMIKNVRGQAANKTGTINILWIGETSTRNRLSVPLILEDTDRYLIQKKGLVILSEAKNMSIVFRPVAATIAFEGTTQWLKSEHVTSIKVDTQTPLPDLIHESDVVIVSTASPTTWEEIIGLKKPMILFTKTPLSFYADNFIDDLKKSCCWCRTEDIFYITLQRLMSEGKNFISELQKINTTDFIRNYVLYQDDGQCVQRVASFLKKIYSKNYNDASAF